MAKPILPDYHLLNLPYILPLNNHMIFFYYCLSLEQLHILLFDLVEQLQLKLKLKLQLQLKLKLKLKLQRLYFLVRHSVSDTISFPLSGCFSPFPHGTSSLSVIKEYLGLGSGLPIFRQNFTCSALLENKITFYLYGTITHYGLTFQKVLVIIIILLA